MHKSFIVNMNKIRSLEGNILDMGNAKVAISQTHSGRKGPNE